MKDRLKFFLAGILTSPVVGWVISLLTGNRIRFRGVVINTKDPLINEYVKACLFWGLYEKQEAEFIQRYLPDTNPVIEMGASIGVISCVLSRKIRSNKVFSLEANPSLISIIGNNLSENGITNCEVMNLAVGNAKEIFFVPGDNNTVGVVSEKSTDTSVPIKCSPLSGIVNDLEIKRFNLVCDIEGSEVSFLYDDPVALDACEWIVIELHNTTFNGKAITIQMLKGRIEELGFKIIDSHGPVIVAKRSKNQNH